MCLPRFLLELQTDPQGIEIDRCVLKQLTLGYSISYAGPPVAGPQLHFQAYAVETSIRADIAEIMPAASYHSFMVALSG